MVKSNTGEDQPPHLSPADMVFVKAHRQTQTLTPHFNVLGLGLRGIGLAFPFGKGHFAFQHIQEI